MFYCYTHCRTCSIAIHIVAIHIVVHVILLYTLWYMFYCYTHCGTCSIAIHIVATHIVIHELGTMFNVMDRLLNVPVGDLTTHE